MDWLLRTLLRPYPPTFQPIVPESVKGIIHCVTPVRNWQRHRHLPKIVDIAATLAKRCLESTSQVTFFEDPAFTGPRDVTIVMQPIPLSLAPFFQEYDLARLSAEKDSFTIIERTLQFGNRSELHWLFTVYSREQVTEWVRRFGNDRLPQPHRTFWQIILDIRT